MGAIFGRSKQMDSRCICGSLHCFICHEFRSCMLDYDIRDYASSNQRVRHECGNSFQFWFQLHCCSKLFAIIRPHWQSRHFLAIWRHNHSIYVLCIFLCSRNQRNISGKNRAELEKRHSCPQILNHKKASDVSLRLFLTNYIQGRD